jgi:hypothetical protein
MAKTRSQINKERAEAVAEQLRQEKEEWKLAKSPFAKIAIAAGAHDGIHAFVARDAPELMMQIRDEYTAQVAAAKLKSGWGHTGIAKKVFRSFNSAARFLTGDIRPPAGEEPELEGDFGNPDKRKRARSNFNSLTPPLQTLTKDSPTSGKSGTKQKPAGVPQTQDEEPSIARPSAQRVKLDKDNRATCSRSACSRTSRRPRATSSRS